MSVQRGRKELSLGNDIFDTHETTVFEGRNWPPALNYGDFLKVTNWLPP